MEEVKKCTKCGKELPIEYFGKDSQKTDGLRKWCKDCVKKHNQRYYLENTEKISKCTKEYRERNREKDLENKKKYYQSHKEETLEYQKKYAKEHPQKVKRYKQKYVENNKEKIKESKKRYKERRKKNDTCFNVILQLRYLIYSSLVLRNNYKKNQSYL